MTTDELTISDLRNEKELLKAEIFSAALKGIARFRDKTGMTPSRITIEMISLTEIGDRRPKYMPSEVRIDLDPLA